MGPVPMLFYSLNKRALLPDLKSLRNLSFDSSAHRTHIRKAGLSCSRHVFVSRTRAWLTWACSLLRPRRLGLFLSTRHLICTLVSRHTNALACSPLLFLSSSFHLQLPVPSDCHDAQGYLKTEGVQYLLENKEAPPLYIRKGHLNLFSWAFSWSTVL